MVITLPPLPPLPPCLARGFETEIDRPLLALRGEDCPLEVVDLQRGLGGEAGGSYPQCLSLLSSWRSCLESKRVEEGKPRLVWARISVDGSGSSPLSKLFSFDQSLDHSVIV